MTAAELAALMKRRRDLFEPALRSATNEIARLAISRSKQLMTEQIYSLPEDLTAQGEARFQRFRATRRPGQTFTARKGDRKWVRTGHLRRSERVEFPSLGQADLVNDAIYAARRHEAGKAHSDLPGFKNPPPDINRARESHWRDQLKEELRESILHLRQEVILKVLRANKGVL
jgi:hypothetical protein